MRSRRIIRLGEGMGASAGFGEPAIERAIEGAVDLPRQDAQSRRPPARGLIATQPAAPAANGRDFCARVLEEVGLDLEIVDPRDRGRIGGHAVARR